jgi:hypothetical protein
MSDISIAGGTRVYLPAVADLYPLYAAGAALALAGVKPQIAGGVLSGNDILVAIAIPVGQPKRGVPLSGILTISPLASGAIILDGTYVSSTRLDVTRDIGSSSIEIQGAG